MSGRIRTLLCLLIILVGFKLAVHSIPAAEVKPDSAGMHHGVVFFCPKEEDEAIRQLELIKKDGFNLIKFASWVWTLPKEGSDLEKRAQAVLNWCDQHDMEFILLHNIQYGSPKQGGGFDQQVLHPEQNEDLLKDWVRVLCGHPCVKGIILGNEVPSSNLLGTPEENPAFWQKFGDWLTEQHGSIDQLNTAWKTDYSSFNDVGVPPKDSPGQIDYRRFGYQSFAGFYGALIDKYCMPMLGTKLYGNKINPRTGPDPFLYRACRNTTVACWDDLVSEYPLWAIKCAADTTSKPLFNGELHLYHDKYRYYASPEKSRYRYFTSTLLGEYMTASFSWGSWNKPETQSVHAATPGILSDLRKSEKYLRLLADSRRDAQLMVLVTEDNYYRPRLVGESSHPLAVLYGHMGTLGKPWKYLLEEDLGEVKIGTLVVCTQKLKPESVRKLNNLSRSVKLLAVDSVPKCDEYGRPLSDDLYMELKSRTQVVSLDDLTKTIGIAPDLPKEYRKFGSVSYHSWSKDRGFYKYSVPYCLVEAHYLDTPEGKLLALINNTPDEQFAPIPWAEKSQVSDLITGESKKSSGRKPLPFKPFEIKLLMVTPENKP